MTRLEKDILNIVSTLKSADSKPLVQLFGRHYNKREVLHAVMALVERGHLEFGDEFELIPRG